MDADVLKERTKRFALRAIALRRSLSRNSVADVVGRQLLRSATSVGANYRAACRARARADFVSKMAIVEEEADESAYWIELLVGSGEVDAKKVGPLQTEADELTAIAAASRKTARSRADRKPKPGRRPAIDNPKSPIDNPRDS